MENLEFDLDRVKKAYEERQGKVNAEQLADAFDTTKNTLYSWKKGVGLDKIKVILTIMKKTGLSFEQLFTHKHKING